MQASYDGKRGSSFRVSADRSTPHRFRRRPKTARYRAAQALQQGPASRLFAALGPDAYLFTLSAADMGLSDLHSFAPALCSHKRMAEWRAAVSREFRGPVMMVFEVGKGSGGRRGRTHCHAIAHRLDGPQHLRRGCESCKPVTDPEGLLVYLNKPPELYSLEAHMDYTVSKIKSPGRKAPRTRSTLLSAPRLAWAESLMHYARKLPSTPSDLSNEGAGRQAKCTEIEAPSLLPACPLFEKSDPHTPVFSKTLLAGRQLLLIEAGPHALPAALLALTRQHPTLRSVRRGAQRLPLTYPLWLPAAAGPPGLHLQARSPNPFYDWSNYPVSTTPNLEKLNPLQKRAAQLSAQGLSDSAVKDALALSVTTWENYRSDPMFVAAVAELKATDTTESDKRLDDEIEALS